MRSTVSYRDKRHPLLRSYNWLGRFFLDTRLPWINLDEESLIAAAKRKARYDDFGSDAFLEPFRLLLGAAESEAQLTFVGRIIARLSAITGLVARLSMQREIADHPEILEQPVRRPLIVVGAPRTGTTLLHRLLAIDPVARPLIAWETGNPAPVGIGRKRRGDLRAFLTAYSIWMAKSFLAPETAGMHKYTYNGAAECTTLLWPSFVFPMTMVLPSIHNWLVGIDDSVYDEAYGIYRLALQVLHWQRPAEDHWVLKSPQHTWTMDSLARVVPEATIIQTHRNLNEVLPSFCSLAAAMMSPYTDAIRPERMGPKAMGLARETLDRMQQARTRIEEHRITDVRYADLVADPVGTIHTIYDVHGYDFSDEYEATMRRWLEQDMKTRRPKHVYSHERFQLDPDEIASEFADYHEEYGIEE